MSFRAAPAQPARAQKAPATRGVFTLRSFAGDAGLVMGGALVANVFNYFFHFVISRLLGPDRYGTLATLLGLAAMVSVVGSAVGTVAMQETARMWALHQDRETPAYLRRVSSVAIVVALWSAAGVLVGGLALSRYLHIVQPALWMTFAAYIGVAAIATFLRGAVQGAHRFAYFAASMIGEGILKLALAALFVIVGFSTMGALGGIVCGVMFGTIIAALAFRRAGGQAAPDSGSAPAAHTQAAAETPPPIVDASESVMAPVMGTEPSSLRGDAYISENAPADVSSTPRSERYDTSRRSGLWHRPQREHLRFGGESLKVLSVSAALTGLLFIDMLFAKHHLSGDAAGYYGAAGTIARTIPYGTGFIGLVLMPKAAAAHHSNRQSLLHLLALTFGLALAGVLAATAVLSSIPNILIGVTYGAKYLAAAPLLRMYAVDASLLALCGLGTSYLIAVRDYSIAPYFIAGLVLDAIAMAAFGTTPFRLLFIAIGVNLLLLPAIAARVAASLRSAPQAPSPPAAEAFS